MTEQSAIEQVENYYAPAFVIRSIRGFGWAFSKIVWRVEFRGAANIPKDLRGGLIVASNHQSYLDPFWIIIPLDRKFRFLAWDRAFTWFGIGRFIRFLGAFPVNIEHGDAAAYQKSVEVLRAGATLVIFPEGSRALSDGELLPFKSGAVRMALEANVPILPVTLRGANKFWAQDMKRPKFFRKIIVEYHPLFYPEATPENTDAREHARAETSRLKEIIEQR